jgi:hypothetical protein
MDVIRRIKALYERCFKRRRVVATRRSPNKITPRRRTKRGGCHPREDRLKRVYYVLGSIAAGAKIILVLWPQGWPPLPF